MGDDLFGGTGDDRIFAGEGWDGLAGGPGDDRLFDGGIHATGDSFDGGAGNDRLIDRAGSASMDDGPGRDLIRAGVGPDIISPQGGLIACSQAPVTTKSMSTPIALRTESTVDPGGTESSVLRGLERLDHYVSCETTLR